MSFWPGIWRAILLPCIGLILSGCFPSSQKAYDEEKDPYLIEARNRFRSYDYPGAAESYNRVLSNNPNSALAHFELGMIYKDKVYDPIAAIYHLDRYLQLRPKSDLGEVVRLHMEAMKIDIAKSVSYGVVARDVQRQMDRLQATNLALRVELTNNRALLATNRFEIVALRTELGAMRAALDRKPQVVTNYITNYVRAPVAPASAPPGPVSAPQNRPAPRPQPSSPHSTPATRPSPSSAVETARRPTAQAALRTHVVKPGQTYRTIALQYGVSQAALQAANPRIEPRRLQAGQLLNIPSPRP